VDESAMRERVARARAGVLATVRDDGSPHVVPVCFALVDDEIVTAVDAKPKSTRALARLNNIRGQPAVALLVDHYADDWTQLWWIRVDGSGRVEDLTNAWRAALQAKYAQYVDAPPAGPAIVIRPRRWSGWEWS
jgi:PPOX class probable F420-dependent enzyme